MKPPRLIAIGILFVLLVIWVTTLSAQQNTLPDPQDSRCWSSLDALRACELQAYNKALDQAQRCSAFPFYHCNDYYQPEQQKTSHKKADKVPAKKTDSTPSGGVNQNATSDAKQPGNAR